MLLHQRRNNNILQLTVVALRQLKQKRRKIIFILPKTGLKSNRTYTL